MRNHFAEICEGGLRIIGEGNIRVKIGTKAVEISTKNAPKFNENVVTVSSLKPFFRITFDQEGDFHGYILCDRKADEQVIRRASESGLYLIYLAEHIGTNSTML